MNRSLLAKNLRSFRKGLNLNQAEFAKPLGIKGSYISAIERGKSIPSESVLLHMEHQYRLNRHWLFTGEGELYIKDRKRDQGGAQSAGSLDREETTIYKDRASDPPESPFRELLEMTAEILASHTDYAGSLAANIRSFHKSVELEKRTSTLEEKCDELIEEVRDLKRKVVIRPDRRDLEQEEVAALAEAADHK